MVMAKITRIFVYNIRFRTRDIERVGNFRSMRHFQIGMRAINSVTEYPSMTYNLVRLSAFSIVIGCCEISLVTPGLVYIIGLFKVEGLDWPFYLKGFCWSLGSIN